MTTISVENATRQIKELVELVLTMDAIEIRRPMVIAIEGNIGAGKSTLLRELEQTFSSEYVVCMQEPVDLWERVCDQQGTTILSKFYEDPRKYSFPFQIMAYTSRLETFHRIMREHSKCRVIICERSLEADKHIFANMLHDDGYIDPISYQVYEMLYKNTVREFSVDFIVYLDTLPEVCHRRIELRSRQGEGNITREYLEKCKQYYDRWLLAESSSEDTRSLCLHVDGNEDR